MKNTKYYVTSIFFLLPIVVTVKYSLVTNPRWWKPETEMIQKQQLDEKYPVAASYF